MKKRKKNKLKPFTLVKWDYKSLPKEWRESNENHLEGLTFIYLGQIQKMKGHSYLQCMKTGKPYVLHTEELKKLTMEEL